jgi:DNA-binding IclR family transcriptional regulator
MANGSSGASCLTAQSPRRRAKFRSEEMAKTLYADEEAVLQRLGLRLHELQEQTVGTEQVFRKRQLEAKVAPISALIGRELGSVSVWNLLVGSCPMKGNVPTWYERACALPNQNGNRQLPSSPLWILVCE